MKDGEIGGIGIIAMVAAVACCALPLLLVAAGGVGFSALIGWSGYLIPALAILAALIIFGMWRGQRAVDRCETDIEFDKNKKGT